MSPKGRTVEQELARIATEQHGVVTRADLLQAGISPDDIKRRVRRGTLIREHRGVYRVGHRASSVEAQYLAAVRACGPGALLSGAAAGHLLGLVKGPPPRPEVTSLVERRVAGVRTRRCRQLDARDAISVRGIPVTSVPETLVDLARILPLAGLARACHEAGVLHRTTPGQVEAVLARRPRCPGAPKLREVLSGGVHVTLSGLESAFMALVGEAGLPTPQTNRPATGRRVDCRWPDHRLTVELDSYRFHHSRHAWELDRRREREAHARGDDFRRYTHGDVFEDPRPMLRELRGLLPSTRPA